MDSQAHVVQKPTIGTGSCIPSLSGMFVHHDQNSGFFVPAPRRDEEEILDQPPLALKLSEYEIQDLLHEERPYAMTDCGPGFQEKDSNQDFALSALIKDGGGKHWSFGVVADGVSTATFWPERASRLACLTSYRFFRILFGQQSDIDLTDHELNRLKRDLVKELRSSFRDDRKILLSEANAVPSTFTQHEYQKRSESNELWYKTTLLICLIGPTQAFVFHSGDGGIWLRRRGDGAPKDNEIIKSAEGPLQNHISLDVTDADISVARISLDHWRSARLILSSDGLDRTLQIAEIGYECAPESDSKGSLRERLDRWVDQLCSDNGFGDGKFPEPDNVSLVVLDWFRGRKFREAIEQPTLFIREEKKEEEAAAPSSAGEEEADVVISPQKSEQPPDPAPVQAPVAQSKEPPLKEEAKNSPKPQAQVRKVLQTALPNAGVVSVCILILAGSLFFRRDQPDDPPERIQDESAAARQTLHEPDVEPISSHDSPQYLEFAVLDPEGPLLRALSEPPEESPPVVLVRELAGWVGQVWDLNDVSSGVTVVAYQHREGTSRDDCEKTEQIVRERAETFAELLRLFVGDIPVNTGWNVCAAPPGISDPTSTEARRLVLFAGSATGCDCEQIISEESSS